MHITLPGLPGSLLPGGTGEYRLQLGAHSPTCIPLEIQCSFWVYWTPLVHEDEDEEEDESREDVDNRTDGGKLPSRVSRSGRLMQRQLPKTPNKGICN
eukprot:4583218-Amphidinium_carterae.1